jgi:hypothetical protein
MAPRWRARSSALQKRPAIGGTIDDGSASLRCVFSYRFRTLSFVTVTTIDDAVS